MSLVRQAKFYAIGAHSGVGQKRKYTDEPYWKHPERVVETLYRLGFGEEVLAAAWLHDVVEDTGISLYQIEIHFGVGVRRLVAEVTDTARKEDGNRKVRSEINRRHIENASSQGLAIKMSDILDNASSIVKYDPSFAKIWIEEKRALLPVFNERGNKRLYDRLKVIIDEYDVDHASKLSEALANQL